MEQNTKHVPLLPELLYTWFARLFRANRVPLIASMIWGALAYTFAFTNKLINHDEVGQLFAKGATVSSGRWGLGFLDVIFPNISMPWIYGVCTVLFIAIAISLIIDLFSIRSKPLQVLLAGAIMVFPSLIGVFGYMFTSSCYGVSFLLAVLSVWLVCRPYRWSVIPALVCLIGSVSIYQSYISVSACLLVLVLIRKLLLGEAPLTVLKKGIGHVLFLVAGLGIYYLATQVILKVLHISFNDYASNNISFSLTSLLPGIRLAYTCFGEFFTKNLHRLVPTEFSAVIHCILIAATLVLLLLNIGIQKSCRLPRCLLLSVLLGILPLAINCMYMITSEESIHTLVLYSFVALYILAAIVADLFLEDVKSGKVAELLRRLAVDSIALALSILVIINVYAANTAYLTLHLRYENAYSFYTSLIAQIRQIPEFRENTKIAVVGYWQSPDFFMENMEFTDELVGVKGFLPSDYSANYFMEYYIGFPAQFAAPEETEAIRQTEEFRDMPVYPYYGSIDIIQNSIVVKLSE